MPDLLALPAIAVLALCMIAAFFLAITIGILFALIVCGIEGIISFIRKSS